MKKIRLVVVGGFLGAGKTSLLFRAAQLLSAGGKRVGVITNDQAPDLVDTNFLARGGLSVREVGGSCFCCDLPGLIRAAGKLRAEVDPDVLLAEPVGSCTDLSATVLQPLKDLFGREFVVSPLSVLADPFRVRRALAGKDGAARRGSSAYIFRKQLEEADLIVLNKVDLLGAEEGRRFRRMISTACPGAAVRAISARTGAGVRRWLDEVLSAGGGGRRIAEVDYDLYAEGEAALGWLNAGISIAARDCCVPDWRLLCRLVMGEMKRAFEERRTPVGHVKILLAAGKGTCVANLTRLGGRIDMRGDADKEAPKARMIVNVRVETAPKEIERILLKSLRNVIKGRLQVTIERLHAFRPARPRPTHRYSAVLPPAASP